MTKFKANNNMSMQFWCEVVAKGSLSAYPSGKPIYVSQIGAFINGDVIQPTGM